MRCDFLATFTLIRTSLYKTRAAELDRASSRPRHDQEAIGEIDSSSSTIRPTAAPFQISADDMSAVTQDTREAGFLFQQLSVASQRGNAVSFHNTFTKE